MKFIFYGKDRGWIVYPPEACIQFEIQQLIRIMKLTTVLVFIMAMGAFASGKAQKVTLSVKNANIKEVFSKLKTQTNYRFLYNEELLKQVKPITVHLVNKEIDDVLDRILAGSSLTYRIRKENITLVQIENSGRSTEITPVQTSISGIVRDTIGVLSGVSVRIKGKSGIGTTTDSDGKYNLSVNTGDILVFSFVGYKDNEVPVGNRKVINVLLLPTDDDLEEVVVLGFGQTQRKIAQTGSTASISTKELKQSPVANIANALAGRLPGLVAVQRSGEPGNDMPKIFIRGIATLNNSEPLITIDGVQKDYKAITLLDPNEIENVTILKDASATALYGVKGANGVIIVTTRRGKIGKPEISVSTEQAIQNAVQLPEFLDSYNNALLANEAYFNDKPTGTPPYSNEALEAFRTGSDPYKYPSVDWMKELFKPNRQSKMNFNISGGAPQVRYFVNVSYVNQGGVFRAEKNEDYDPNSNFNRYNFRSNVDIDFDKNFSIGLKLFGAIENRRHSQFSDVGLFWAGIMMPPDNPIRYPTGYYAKNTATNNPFWLLNEFGYVEQFNSSLSGMLSATEKLDFITKGLSLKGNFSFDGYFNNNLNRDKQVPFAVYKGTGDYNDPESYTYFGEYMPLSAPTSSFSQNRDIWMDMSLNYQRSFGKHEFIGLLLANRTQKVIANEVPYVSQGMVGRMVYNYASKYFVELNAGYNGTDNFARGKRYGLFPAFSAGWILSEESFFKSNAVDLLKIRGSFGLVGNDLLGSRRWLFVSEYANAGGYSFGETLQGIGGIAEGAMANPNVSWEKAKKLNLGIEMRLLKGLVGLTVDVFEEQRYDILRTRSSIPDVLGVTSSNLTPANIGKVNNKGIEMELTHNNRIGNVTYFVNVNGSFARNKIVFQDEAPRAYPWMVRTGHAIGQKFGLTTIGFFKDQSDIDNSPVQFGSPIPGDLKYKDLNDDGKIDGNDITAIGKTTVPEVFYGLSGGLNWKSFDLSFLFQGAAGTSKQTSDIPYYAFDGGSKTTKYHLGRWTPETANTATYPALHYNGSVNNHRTSDFFMENNSYLRLKNVEVGYTFKNAKFGKKIAFSGIRLYANGMNLYTWTDATLFDPENTEAGYVYPLMRIFNFGLSVTF